MAMMNEKRLMIGPRGSIILFDGGIWHKGGPATDLRRWSMFTYYALGLLNHILDSQRCLEKNSVKKPQKNLEDCFIIIQHLH